MKFTQDALVGLIFFAGLGLLLYFTVVVEGGQMGDLFGAEDKEELERRGRIITVDFAHIGGVTEGTKVRASGMDIGKVREYRRDPKTGRVAVEMELWYDLVVYPEHRFTVKPESALGGQFVEVEIGDTAQQPVSEYNLGRVQDDALSAVASLVDENRENFSQVLANLRQVTEGLAAGEGTIGRLLASGEAYDEIMAILDEMKKTIVEAREGQGTIAKLLNESTLYDDLSASAENVKSITGRIDRGEGTLGKLINDEEAYGELKKALSSVQTALEDVQVLVAKARNGEGTIGRLFNDSSLYDNANEAARNIAEISQKINNGEGTLGRLLTDDELYEGVLTAISNVEAITDDVSRGKGTIGKLVKDETLYFELRKAVRGITASVEDAREQAPVSLFTSIIFNAF